MRNVAPQQGRGYGMQRHSSKVFASALAAAAMVVAASAIAGTRAGEPFAFIAVGAETRAPIGWMDFCTEYAPECDSKPLEPRDVVLTPRSWKDLARVNKWVNDSVKPMTDLEHWGV